MCYRKLRRQEKVHFTSGLNNYFYQNIYSTNFYIYQKNTDYIQYQSSIRCYYTLYIFARGDTGQWCQIVGKALSVMIDRWLFLPFGSVDFLHKGFRRIIWERERETGTAVTLHQRVDDYTICPIKIPLNISSTGGASLRNECWPSMLRYVGNSFKRWTLKRAKYNRNPVILE